MPPRPTIRRSGQGRRNDEPIANCPTCGQVLVADSEPPVETIVTPQDLVDAAVDSAAAANIAPHHDTATTCKAAMRERSKVRVAAKNAAKQLQQAARRGQAIKRNGRAIT
jgi:hypothetical protein